MSLTSVLPSEVDMSIDDDGWITYTVTYKCFTDSEADGPLTVLSAGLTAGTLPKYLDRYSFGNDSDSYSLRHGISMRPMPDTRKGYFATATFHNKPLPVKSAFTSSDPLAQPPDCYGDFVEIEEPFERDVNDVYVMNSALDPFEGLTRESGLPTLIIEQNYSASAFGVLLPTLAQIMNPHRVNATVFWGLSAGVWKISRCPWRALRIGNGYPYYRVAYEFRAKYGGWDAEPADRGWRWNESGDVVRAHDDSGLPLSQPAFLDGLGNQLTAGESIVFCDGSSVSGGTVPGPFVRYDDYDFGLLGVPTSKTAWEAMIMSGVNQ